MPSDPPSHTSTAINEQEFQRSSVHENDKNLAKESVSSPPTDKDPFLVSFEENDPHNPLNWPSWRKWYLTLSGGLVILNASVMYIASVLAPVANDRVVVHTRSFASAAPSGVIGQIMHEFGMSAEVATLMVSLFIAGYCVGPLLWGPMSEQIGRRPIFLISFLFYTGFQVGCALSRNTASLLVFRFLSGCFAAAPLTNSGGVVSDVWDAKTRGKAMTLFAVAPFAGPALGPVVSGWISVGGASWRWLFWVLAIFVSFHFAGACLVLLLLTMPETYGPAILVAKAKKLRKDTNDERYFAPLEEEDGSFSKQLEKILAKPFKIMFREPMLFAITMYMSVGLSLHPLLLWRVTGLMFLPISIGGFLGVIFYLIVFNPRYERYVDEYAPNLVPPEKRLEITMVCAPLFAISFFWFGWTSYPSISLWSPLMAGGVMGFSILGIFLSLFNYIIDTYLFIAASALAASTVVRSLFGAAFPLFATQMYNALNPRWASTLLGFIALGMTPIPFVLRRYGPTLRAKSRYAPDVPLRIRSRVSAV
ncbi:hypothetical protein EW146_g832 [Bondarzewia mesenterica]|uniref:Major facilitator superfamily (MFS) profile domain-containing protein n=1 Tax=Bondarzewia mesenterica TaxID=1095465 RepID=A0A4S4M7L9_9AGAM|nr:hypothetical protein EW146_g832 [Bondarzewia mesenterica]